MSPKRTRAKERKTSLAKKRPDQPRLGRPTALLWSIAAGLLVVHFVLAATSVRHKCAAYDELAHLTRGYSYTITGDYRLGPPHPPLAHYWAALPGRGTHVVFPKLDQDAWRTSDVWSRAARS